MTTSRWASPTSGAGGLFDPARLERFGTAVAVGMVVAFVLFLATADGVATLGGGRLGGDWAAFYAAGELARTSPELVLDAAAQAAAQQPYLEDAFAPFAYPPVLAFLFAPLSLLAFRAGFAVYVVLLAAAGVWAVRLTLDVLDVRSPAWRRVGLLGAMTYAPVFRSVGGAQNATLTLLVLAGGFRLLRDERQVLAGVVFGLLWFKPQYAVPVLALLVVSGRWWRAGIAGLLPGVVLWLANAAVFGVGWMQTWWDEIASITKSGNKVFHTGLTVSPVEYLRGRLPAEGAEIVGVTTALVVGACFAVLVRRQRDEAWVVQALLCGALLLTALHALPYELVLLVPVLGAGLVVVGVRGVPWAVAAYLAGWGMIVDVHPVVRVAYVLTVVGVVVWATRGLRTPRLTARPGGADGAQAAGNPRSGRR